MNRTRFITFSRVATAGLAALVCLMMFAEPTLAQDTDLRPPTPTATEDPPLLRTYFVLALLGALVVGANAIPSRRGHQD